LRTAQSLWPTTNWRGHLASGPSPPPWGRRPGGERERRITTGSAVDPLVSRLFDRSGGTARGRAGERSRLARECPRAGGRYGRLLGLALPARSRTSSRASPRRPLAPGPALSKPQRRSPRGARSESSTPGLDFHPSSIEPLTRRSIEFHSQRDKRDPSPRLTDARSWLETLR
jgi:hypothetical protein